MKTIDDIFEWEGFGNGFGKWQSKCRLRFYEVGEITFVIATELPDNAGTSITNCAENLCIIALNKYNIDLRRVVWIEHYPGEQGIFKSDRETFDLVTFDIVPMPNPLAPKEVRVKLQNPKWKRLKREHVESLIGELP